MGSTAHRTKNQKNILHSALMAAQLIGTKGRRAACRRRRVFLQTCRASFVQYVVCRKKACRVFTADLGLPVFRTGVPCVACRDRWVRTCGSCGTRDKRASHKHPNIPQLHKTTRINNVSKHYTKTRWMLGSRADKSIERGYIIPNKISYSTFNASEVTHHLTNKMFVYIRSSHIKIWQGQSTVHFYLTQKKD